jgi:hypothetical protein
MCAVGITHIPDLARVRDAATEAGLWLTKSTNCEPTSPVSKSGLEVIMAQLARQKGDLALAALGIIFCTSVITTLLVSWLVAHYHRHALSNLLVDRRGTRRRNQLGFGARASIARSHAGIPVAASLPIDRAGDRQLSRLRQGSYRAACVRRRRRGSEYAVADRLRGASKGSMRDEGLQSITTALPTSGSIAGMPDEVTLRALHQTDQIRTDSAKVVIGLEVI